MVNKRVNNNFIISRPVEPDSLETEIWYCSPAHTDPIDDPDFFFNNEDDEDDENDYRIVTVPNQNKIKKDLVNLAASSGADILMHIKMFIKQLEDAGKPYTMKDIKVTSYADILEYADDYGIYLYVEDKVRKELNETNVKLYKIKLEDYNMYLKARRESDEKTKLDYYIRDLREQRDALDKEIIVQENKKLGMLK